MPVLIGELEKITGSPSSVTQVMVRAHTTRITGSALTTDELVPIPVDRQGRFEVPLRPGKAVLVLVHGGRVGEGERFPMLVEEGLGTIVSAIKLASDKFDDYELDELERAAADMLASLDKGLVAANRAEVAKEDAEKARDKAGEYRDGAEKAAGTAAADAATGAVQKADEKLSGYVTAAEEHAEDAGGSATSAGKDAGRAETARQGAETIQQGLPDKIDQELETKLPGELDTRVPAELDKHLPGELDERVPPLVASSIADDRAVADAAAAAVEGAVDEAMPTKADTVYVDQQDRALSERIDEEKWMRGTAPGEGLDHLLGLDHEGLWKVGASIPGKPGNAGGWVQVVYDPYSGSTEQVFWASSPTVPGEWKRKYWSGSWRSWHSVVWEQGNVATGADLNTITQTGAHTVMSTVANDAPGAGIGPLIVFPFGNGVVQIRIDGRASRMWSRRVGTAVDPWVEYATMNQVNAAITDALAGAGDESWYRGSATDHAAHADDLRFLGVFYTQGLDGMPFTSLGAIEVLPIAYGGFIQRATDWSTLEVWTRKTAGGVFQEWTKGSNDVSANTGAWIKRVPLAVTVGGTLPPDSPGAGRYRILTQFTAPIIRWRLHISNVHPVNGATRGDATLWLARVGIAAANPPTMDAATVVDLHSGSAKINAGDEWVSDWVKHDLSTETLIDYSFSAADSYSMLAPAWKLQEDGSWEQTNRAPLWIWIEAETYAQTPTVAIVGDSTGGGHGSHMPVWDSALAIAGRKQEFLPVLYTNSGDTLNGNTTATDPNLSRWSEFGPYDSVIIQAGSNDIHRGDSLADLQSRYLDAVDAVQHLSTTVYAGTVKPRFPAHQEYDGTRVAYNEWLRTIPGGAQDVIDFSATIAPGGEVSVEHNDDGAHLNSAGHHKMAEAISFPICRPRVVGTWRG